MKKENQNFYDVFISYRRVGGRDVARILQLQLVQRGLRCFFDFDELQNGDFNEAIYDAIDRSKNFIVVLSNGALERCVNEGDWVRREIECALEKKINVVPVAPNDAPRAYPAKLPPSLECLRKLQIAPLNMEDLLEESVDKIIRRSLKGVDYDLKSGRVKGFSGSASEVMELQLDLPKLGKRIEDADLAKLSDGDKDRFKKAVCMYRNLRYRSALAEFRKIKNQDDPIVKYYVLRIAYEFEPVDDAEFDLACTVARDLGCTDAMIVLAGRNLNAASEFPDVPYKVCLDWLCKAIAGGNAYAYVNLGNAYSEGKGVGKDKRIARLLYQKSAEEKCLPGIIALGLDYVWGGNGKKDVQAAKRILRPVLRHLQENERELCGSNVAGLAILMLTGEVMDRNLDKFRECADALQHSKGNDAERYFDYVCIGHWLSAIALQIDVDTATDEEKRNAFKGLVKSVEKRNKCQDTIRVLLGRFYENGIGTEVDLGKAVECYRTAADNGDADGMEALATVYLQDGPYKDVEKGRMLLEDAAAEAGHPDAMVQLGFAYLNGTGVDENKTESETWFVKAAETGDVDAENTLGVRYYNGDFGKEDFAKALEWIRKAANDGHPNAMNNLGQMYRDGDAGLDVDDKMAVKWFRKAAKIGFPDAMTNLGFAYLFGKGVVENLMQAEEWFIKGAETGDADAECSLGTRYSQGAFGKVDVSKAIEWWLKAAEHGDSDAMTNLASCYRDGDNGEKDMVKAEEWYLKAAKAGNGDATCSLAMCYYRGDFGQVDKVKAYEWSLKAADLGDKMAMYNLGCMYQNGDGAQKDMGRALTWFRMAADKGVVLAMRDIGLVYLFGDGVQVDTNEAERWLVKAAETEDAESECCLGTRYFEGAFGKRDCIKALGWWRKAADQGDRDALSNLGRIYMDGDEGVEKDVRKGVAYLKQAAEDGNSYAMERLGNAYMRGEGVVVDETMAKEWMSKAVDAGNARAEYGLGCWLLKGELGEKDVHGAIMMFESAASHEYPFAFVALGHVFSNPKSAEDGVPVDLDRARDCFKKADEAGVDLASEYLGLDVLGLLGRELESYDDVAKTLAENPLEDSERSRIFRKARSWFNKPIVNECEDDEVLGSCLRWLARLARYEQRDAEAVELYRKAVEKGDEQAKRELAEVEPASGGKDVMMKDETVMPPVAAPAVVQDKTVAEPLGDLTRAELVFLRKARRFKANDGRIDAEEKKELKDVAVELGIDPVRREELIEQVEDEYIQAGK